MYADLFTTAQKYRNYSGEPDALPRRKLVYLLGNFILLTGSTNISSSNSGSSPKKDKFEQRNGLLLSKWFAKKNRCTQVIIRHRAEHLATLSPQTWIN